ncbi:MAG: tetratricopeptide repeat protein, partial [Candidatus Hydrogenedentes bacterium]|nr:tetratricopeptide repeat protein [Candidatus Hydrogenedentota bacterium]
DVRKKKGRTMATTLVRSMTTFSKNLWVHAKRIVMNRESVGEAVAGIRADGRKLTKAFEAPDSAERRRRARTLLRAGRDSYNGGNYAEAEARFREALSEDPRCTLAITYLGHTLFQCGRLTEAKAAWKRAHDQDPDSEAGQKAFAKLRHVDDQGRDVVTKMQERVERL